MNYKEQVYSDILYIAKCALDKLTDEDIQQMMGSDHYHELKKFISKERTKLGIKRRSIGC